MKQELRQIYVDLSQGKVSQQEAFESIKAIKLEVPGVERGTLLATPRWQNPEMEEPAGATYAAYSEHYIFLCELPNVNAEKLGSLLPGSQCVSIEAGDQKNIAHRYSEYALACLERIQIILQGKPQGRVLIHILVVDNQEQALFAGLSGLLKTAALENPQLMDQLILVPGGMTTEEVAQRLEAEKAGGGGDEVIRYEQGERQVLGWEEVPADGEKPPRAFDEQGVYLITGGLGGLGVVFAKEILEQTGQARVVLTGRSTHSGEKQAWLEALGAQSGRVSYRQMDVEDLDQVQQVIAGIQQEYGQLNGILHSAGMIADSFLRDKSEAQLRAVLGPKVAGTYNLDQASQEVELDFFVLFSSVAGAMGNLGQADYATANGFMDQFAAYRNRQVGAGKRHGRTRSINWPLWQAGGMKIDAGSQKLLQQITGMQPMQTASGIEAFYRILALPYDQVLVVEGDRAKITTYLQEAGMLKSPFDGETVSIYQYANKAEEFYSDVTLRASSEFKEEYLTFAPFENRKPGFSMSRVFLDPEKYPDETSYVRAKQIEMRQVLFCEEDFGKVGSVLDFGCGHGTDVIQIGALFPHLQVHGYTITRDQAILGNRRISNRNLDGSRVTIYHRDSSRDAFPAQYDLAFGIEVSFHIRNKVGLFTNLCNALHERGRILLADYVSNIQGSIDDPNVEISIPTQREWANLTSQFGLEIDEIIDVSPQISNFLYDPDFKDNIRNLAEVSQSTLTNYANQSASLERGWLSYVLIKLKRSIHGSQEEIESHNLYRLQHPTPYPAALKSMLRRQHVQYPPSDALANHRSLENGETETAQDPLHRHVSGETAGMLRDRPSNGGTRAAVSVGQLQQQLKIILATVLCVETSIIDADKPFVEFGLDSFLGVEMMIAINQKYGTKLSNVKLFDYPTVREFSLFLQEEIKKLSGDVMQPLRPAVKSPAPIADSFPSLKKKPRVGRAIASNRARSEDRVAIVGMSGRYPKADNLKQYWENLVHGRNCIVEVPKSRWDVNQYYDPDPARKDKTNSKWLGALDDGDCFDPLFFRISPQEAEYMDPQHRLFLQESYKAFEDAGYSGNALSNRKCGVYLGISTNEYTSLLSRNRILSVPVTSNSYAVAAARIAYYLNLKGPAMAVDTACSSSLVAIHLASQALLSGEIDMALAGGVCLWLAPESYLAMSQAGMFSSVGQCKTFDDAADGIVVGEGVGAVVLKRLKDARADNDFIYGVILGSGINQDGRTNGITAPSVNSQIELERGIYAKYKIDPDTISYVETHGTGTKLGDPIELEALATVFREKTAKKNYCALASVKSNIGHTSSAAGMAAVHKVLLSMQHRTLIPSLNVTKENSHFDFKNSPFYITRKKQPWNVAQRCLRRAAVSSFGFSGTNAHLVIEEYRSPAKRAVPLPENTSFIVLLSARTAEQLRQRAKDLLEFIGGPQQDKRPAEHTTVSSGPVDLAALAYTLQIGRQPMEERLGVVVSSIEQLAEKLNAYVHGEKNIEDVYQGRMEPGQEAVGQDDDMQEVIDRWIARKKFSKAVDLWTRGLNVDWNKLYTDVRPQRISLPTYPFAKEHYWIEENSLNGRSAVNGNTKSIEDIINQIGDDMVETEQAVKALKMLV